MKLSFVAFNCIKCGRLRSMVELAASEEGVLGVRVHCTDCNIHYDRVITLDEILTVVRAKTEPSENRPEPKWARRFL